MENTAETHILEETRGRKTKKIFNILPGESLIIKKNQRSALVRQAKKNGWEIKTRAKNSGILVFRVK